MHETILRRAVSEERAIVKFLRDLIAIRSLSSQEEEVIRRVALEMERLGYDDVTIDPMGNVLGRIGKGRRLLALDAHVDTVDVGDERAWKVDPFRGAEAGGIVYGRGACDMKGALASIVYAGGLIKKLGLEEDYTLMVVGSVQEEDCDGLCWQYLLRESGLKPDLVVIAEPTDLGLYRGHRGRMEIEVRTRGVSCHGSAPERGVNAIYAMAPIIMDVERLHGRLTGEPFLGKGSVTISAVRSTSPSLCAVADGAVIHLDRRLAQGETMESALGELRDLESVTTVQADVAVLDYAVPSWRGLVYPTKKYYPTWLLPEDHPSLGCGARTYRDLFGREANVGRWVFSTNGVAVMGMHGVPCLGFGPGNEIHAHTAVEQVSVEQLVQATAWYAAFPRAFSRLVAERSTPDM